MKYNDFFGEKMQCSIIKMLVICVKCNNVLSLQPHQYLSWIMKKKINIYPSVSSGIGGGTKTEKNESNNSFYNFLFS